MLDRAGHNSFTDAPEAFFNTLREFVVGMPAVAPSDLARWKDTQGVKTPSRPVP